MTIAHVNTTIKETTVLESISVPYCSPVTSGNVLLMAVYNKYATGSAPTTPSGWTQLAQRPGGIGAAGNDAGTGILTIFRKESDGTEAGTVNVVLTGTANMIMGFMIQYSKASGSSWGFASASGVDASAGTAWSVTADSDPGLVAGDMLLTFSAINGNLSLAFVSGSVSQSGITFGSHTERFDDNTTAGSDAAMTEYEHPVSSGTSSGNPIFTMTGDGSGASSPTGPTIFLRLREISGTTYNDAFSITKRLAATKSLLATIAGSVSLSKRESIVESGLGIYETNIPLSKQDSVSLGNIATLSNSILLSERHTLLDNAGLNIQDTFSLGKQLVFPEVVITLSSVTGGYAFGEQNPTQGETAVSWQTWSDGAAGIPDVTGDADWGKLKLDESGEEGRSAVYDLGSEATRTFTLTKHRYGTGDAYPLLQIRTSTTSFAQDDATPTWADYSAPVSVNCRYVQIRASTSEPDMSRTVHAIGDLHFGSITASRAALIITDANSMTAPAAHLIIGDITEAGTEAQDILALDFMDDLPATAYTLCASHDIWNDDRTPAEWATAYSMPGQNYVVDLTFCKLICIGAGSVGTGNSVPAGTLTWIGEQLTAAGSTPCLICFHVPLYNTTLSSDPEHYLSSATAGWYATTNSAIRAMLADYDNVVGWVQGHIHAPYNAPQFIHSGVEGSHTMAYISTSSPYYTDIVTGENLDEIVVSVYITIPASGPMEVRIRDHTNQEWIAQYRIAVG